ncbi:Alpha/Beta hydrolase protein [Elsinoe ampelina]|uniref:Alpha/Beta hydrolase protein n=1 Tax=Elsinoe ampelina TaxID=302913 RepID=A0A6A6GBL1_9PEZI|nr:Alpha/Beta hydrolase protein [Elsinoe ampelina]
MASINSDLNVLILTDGRKLAYADYGAQHERVVIFFHGLPSSRLEARLWQDTANALSIRIVAPDRPGLGISTRHSTRKVVDYPVDVAALVAHLKVTGYAVLGSSGGGAYALACGTRRDMLPGLKAVSVVVGLPPRGLTFEGMSMVQRFSFWAMDKVPAGAVGWLWDFMVGKTARDPDQSKLRSAVEKSIKAQNGVDAEASKNDWVIDCMTEALRGAFAQGPGGYVDDAALAVAPWGFQLDNIKDVNVLMWYGEKDDIAPAAAGRAMAQRIPGAVLTVYEGEGHSAPCVKHQAEILRTLSDCLD